jgi:transposase
VVHTAAKRLGQDLVPDGSWEIVEPLIPPQTERAQGGGTRQGDDRSVFTAVVQVLTTGCAWRHLSAEFGVSKATAHRRSVAWTRPGCGAGCTGQSSVASASAARRSASASGARR